MVWSLRDLGIFTVAERKLEELGFEVSERRRRERGWSIGKKGLLAAAWCQRQVFVRRPAPCADVTTTTRRRHRKIPIHLHHTDSLSYLTRNRAYYVPTLR